MKEWLSEVFNKSSHRLCTELWMRKYDPVSSISDYAHFRVGQGIMDIKGSGQGEKRAAVGSYKVHWFRNGL